MVNFELSTGDVLAILKDYPDNSFDALLCDPPYGFSFMGKAWDYDVPSVDIWRECLRVLKPGALLLSFAGARTQHRIATGIEDAGFELRDCLLWLYGKGFPKSQNISKALDDRAYREGEIEARNVKGPTTQEAHEWEGYGTALKPAYEPIILARKPLDGTMAENILQWGTGGLAIDACRVGDSKDVPASAPKDRHVQHSKGAEIGRTMNTSGFDPDVGRWPANVIFDEAAAAYLDLVVGPRDSNPYRENVADGAVLSLKKRAAGGKKERGLGPSRFFYCAKVSTKEREAGCEALAHRNVSEMLDREEGSAGLENPRAGAGRTGGARNHHPTLKPIALTEYLARLILPPTECPVLLVPFAGAGSEMIGATKAGWPAILGIEQDAAYVEIARARLEFCGEEK